MMIEEVTNAVFMLIVIVDTTIMGRVAEAAFIFMVVVMVVLFIDWCIGDEED